MSVGHWVITGINPEPWTSPEVNIGRRGGKIVPLVYKREAVRQYQEAVAEECRKMVFDGMPFTSEMEVRLYFWRELQTNRSRMADATNLQKSTEDALHEILFVNDVKNVDVHSVVVEQGVGVVPTIIIEWQMKQDHDHIDRAKKLRKEHLDAIQPVSTPEPRPDFDPEKFF